VILRPRSAMTQSGSKESPAAYGNRVFVHGAEWTRSWASQGGGQWRYHHYDVRGHCILLTSPSGALLEQYDYDAFGFPYFYSATGAKQGLQLYGNRFLFTGREWLGELRLYDFRNRMYQPELGRFLQPDPKQFDAGDYNLYRYCHNDRVNKSDPLGLVPGDPFGSSEDAARDVHSSINPTSIKQNTEYGSVIYSVGGKFYASPTFTNGAQTRVTLGTEGDKSRIPKEVRSQATRVGDYHSHGDYSKIMIDPKTGAKTIVRASKSEDQLSDHPLEGDSKRAGIILEKVPNYRLFLGTPSKEIKRYNSKKNTPL
jgi:RHS repeat-associated protein